MPEWLASRLPEGWNGWHLAAFTVGIAMTTAAISIVIVGIVLARIPHDYFVNPDVRKPNKRHPVLHWIFVISKNLLGVFLVILGVLLSFPGVPGQGLLTILMGVALVDFPGKYHAERWLLSRPFVLRNINRLRTRVGRPPLLVPEDCQPGGTS